MASSTTRYSSLAGGPAGSSSSGRPSSSAAVPSSATLSKFKVVVIGDAGSGKTSIIKNFIYGTFSPEQDSTVGIDFLSKTLYLDDRTIRLQIWDSAGQERFRSLIPSYIRDSSIAIVCYDITSRPSFVNAGRWIEDVRAERGTDVLIVLVGNKTDMTERRVISPEEGERKAREEGVLFIECSAKTGHNVQQLFKNLSSALPGQAAGSASGSGAGTAGGRVNLVPGGRGGGAGDNGLIDVKLNGAGLIEGGSSSGDASGGGAGGLGSYCGGCGR